MAGIAYVSAVEIRKEGEYMEPQKHCEGCGKDRPLADFYFTRRRDKYPDGKLSICKDCLTASVDLYNKETFLPILQEVDIPYYEDIWNKRMQFDKERFQDKVSETEKCFIKGVLGRYISLMRLKSFSLQRFCDSPGLEEKK